MNLSFSPAWPDQRGMAFRMTTLRSATYCSGLSAMYAARSGTHRYILLYVLLADNLQQGVSKKILSHCGTLCLLFDFLGYEWFKYQ